MLGPRLQIPRNLEEPWLAMDLIADNDEEEQGVALASDPDRLRDSGVPASNFEELKPLCNKQRDTLTPTSNALSKCST